MFLDKNILKNRILNKKFQPNSLTTSQLQKKKANDVEKKSSKWLSFVLLKKNKGQIHVIHQRKNKMALSSFG